MGMAVEVLKIYHSCPAEARERSAISEYSFMAGERVQVADEHQE